MAYSMQIKSKAAELRREGFSIKEIAKILHIAVSTSSSWLRELEVSEAGKTRMSKQASLHRYKMSLRWKEKKLAKSISHQQEAKKILEEVVFTKPVNKLICAVMFWAEGAKTNNHVAFINSDPHMIELFLNLLRQSYELDERKFRVSVHLHDYHDPEEIIGFWSEVTNIAKSQFFKPYIKPHTGFRKKKNYKGCVAIRYYDSEIACQLEAIYNNVLTTQRAVVQW